MYESPGVYSPKELKTLHKIGQLVMPRLDFNDPESVKRSEMLVKDYRVCGFIIFNGEIEQVRETTISLQSLAEIPLFFGVDAERGLGQIVSGATYFPFLMSQGAIDDPALLKKQAAITADEMSYAGLNLLFAPVLDVNLNPLNPIINIRSFGDSPDMVSRMGEIFIREVQKRGILCCAKHFPGHGDTFKDSHSDLPEVNKSKEKMQKEDLLPFLSALENNVGCIMPAHISYPKLDKSGKPATISREILNDLLRVKMGFNGLIVSDSFKMDALDKLSDEYENALEAISAGLNIILDPENPEALIESLSLKEREIEPEVNKSLNRIFFHKRFIKKREDKVKVPDFEENRKISEVVSARSVCRLKGNILTANNVILYVFDSCKGHDNNFDSFAEYLESRKDVKVIKAFYPDKPSDYPDSTLIFIVSTTVSAWTNYFELAGEYIEFIEGFKSFPNDKVLLSFGSPYSAVTPDLFDTVLFAFDSTITCQMSVADVLLGIKNPEGKLPVAL